MRPAASISIEQRASFAGGLRGFLLSETFPFQRRQQALCIAKFVLPTGMGLLHPFSPSRNLRGLRPSPFFSRLDANHIAHSVCSLVNLVTRKTENGMEQMQWYAKSQYVRRKK
jgi:hypothetical protein